MPTYQYLTDRSLAQSTAITPTTIIHIVTTADTTQSVYGSSYKVELQQLIPIFSGSTFSGGSGNCITDLYTSNIHSCSPLNINPNDEGNVYFGSNSGITIDLANDRLGIGTTTPDYPIQIYGSNSSFYYDPTSAGGRFNVSGNTGVPRFDVSIAASGTRIATGGSVGMRTWSDGTYTGYGKVGDMFMYAGNETYGLNFINPPGTNQLTRPTEDYIRFYAGQLATGTADVHIQGSGATRGYVGIGTETPTEKLDVSGKTKTINFQMTSGGASGYVLTSDASGNASWQSMYGYQYYSAVTITSAQTLSIGSSPVEILPAPGANKYYDFKVFFEYIFNTSAYSTTGKMILIDSTTKRVTNQLDFNGQPTNRVLISDINSQNEFLPVNSKLEFTTSDGTNPTLGDSSFKVKIYYNIIDFG